MTAVKESAVVLCYSLSEIALFKRTLSHWTLDKDVRQKYLKICVERCLEMRIISDEEIVTYLKEKKLLPEDFKPNLTVRSGGWHNRFEQEVKGESGNTFKLIVRQNKFNAFDFSVILGVFIAGNFFHLKRYNGNSHRHANKLEKEEVKGFHIHTATERYQEAKWQPEGYAISTTSYYDWRTALSACLKENNFVVPVEREQRRLNDGN